MIGMTIFAVLIIVAILWIVMQSEKVDWFPEDFDEPWPRNSEDTFGDDGDGR